MLTKPQITVNLNHPPRLGLNIKKVAFGPSYGQCSDEILNQLSGTLVSNGIEVMDRQRLRMRLAEQHLSLNGYIDQQSAVRMGRLLGPTALVFVKISQCDTEQNRTSSDGKDHKRNYNATMKMHIRGTLQTVDLVTGRIFSASPIVEDAELTNHSTDREPDFPSRDIMRDNAIQRAAYDASTMFVGWTEQKKLYFFNDKECNLASAYTLLKVNDFDGAVRQSEENIVTCQSWPNVKDSTLAHAYYNAGLAYLLVNEHEKAMRYLLQSEQLKGGQIVTDTITEANNSARLDAEMRSVAARTESFEQEQQSITAPSQPVPDNVSGAGGSTSSPEPVEERLRKLDNLFKKGLISGAEYQAKRAEILKDM